MIVTTSSVAAAPQSGASVAIARAIADDLELLAILHDREPTAELIAALQACAFADQLSLRLAGAEAGAAIAAFGIAIGELPAHADAAALDRLAADYADVYLRHSYRAAPTESVWLTEDGLDRQGPMLSIRAQHRRHGVTLSDSYHRTEDHLVPQLRFVAHLLHSDAPTDGPKAAARFLDAHLLRWTHLLAARLVQVNGPNFFTELAVLTACYLDEARQHLEALTGIARVIAADGPGAKPKPGPTCGDIDQRYVPGIAPSW